MPGFGIPVTSFTEEWLPHWTLGLGCSPSVPNRTGKDLEPKLKGGNVCTRVQSKLGGVSTLLLDDTLYEEWPSGHPDLECNRCRQMEGDCLVVLRGPAEIGLDIVCYRVDPDR